MACAASAALSVSCARRVRHALLPQQIGSLKLFLTLKASSATTERGQPWGQPAPPRPGRWDSARSTRARCGAARGAACEDSATAPPTTSSLPWQLRKQQGVHSPPFHPILEHFLTLKPPKPPNASLKKCSRPSKKWTPGAEREPMGR